MPSLSAARFSSVITAAAAIFFCGLTSIAVGADLPGLAPAVVATLGKMQKTLSASQFSFQAHTLRAYAGPNGELLHIEHVIKATIKRPDHLVADVTGDDGASKFFYDGRTLTLFGEQQKQYAAVPVTGTIADMLDTAQDRLDIDFPLAGLLNNKPDETLVSDAAIGGQVGTATIDGVRCNHYFFMDAPDLDLELWVEDNDKALPRRVIVTYRSLPGRPTFVADLSNWDFSVHPTDAEFAFHAPAGVSQVELKPSSRAIPASTK